MDTESLLPIAELNELYLACMARLVRRQAADSAPDRLGQLWLQMDATALRRAAGIPVLLLDIRGWDRSHEVDKPPLFAPPRCISLMHSVLVLAWHLCRTGAAATVPIHLGLHQDDVRTISAMKLTDIERVARNCFRHLRPRWEDRPQMWIELLAAASADDTRAFEAFRLRTLYELVSQLPPKAPSPSAPRVAHAHSV